jgi:hypothetical protein
MFEFALRRANLNFIIQNLVVKSSGNEVSVKS